MNTRIYPLGSQWGLFIDETYERIFNTKQEAEQMTDKLNKAAAAQRIVTVVAEIPTLIDTINAREYGQGQGQAITDADVISLNIDAADIFNAINVLSQVETLLTDGTPVQADYMPVVNKVRTA